MEEKICTICGKSYPATEEYFYWHKKRKTLRSICKICKKSTDRIYYEENKEDIIKKSKIYRMKNIEILQIKRKEYEKTHMEQLKEYRKNYKEQAKLNHEKYRNNNSEKLKQYYKDYAKLHEDELKKYKQKYHKKNRAKFIKHMNEKASFQIYGNQLTIEEDPKDDGDDYLIVKCAYCGKYFRPIIMDVNNRIQCLKGRIGGESRLYCSKGCKHACPIFYKSKWPKGFKKASSREVDPIIRQMCFKRDDYTCQKCEKTINEIEIHSHHIEGAVQMPLLANDVDNTITLCKPCHQWVHRQKGCTYYDMRCKR